VSMESFIINAAAKTKQIDDINPKRLPETTLFEESVLLFLIR